MSTLSPHLAIGGLAIGLLATLGAALLQIVTLPVEIDASFRRALPILAGEGYLALKDLPAAKQVLIACAAGYVAGTLISTLNVFRWLRFTMTVAWGCLRGRARPPYGRRRQGRRFVAAAKRCSSTCCVVSRGR